MIGDSVYATLCNMTLPSVKRAGLVVLSGFFERKAFGEIATCELEAQPVIKDAAIALNGAMDIVMIGSGTMYEYYIITKLEREYRDRWKITGESLARVLWGYYPDWYAGTSDARWNGDAAQGVATVLRPTEFRPTHFSILPIGYYIMTPSDTLPTTTVNVPHAWASRVEAAQQITREAHIRGSPLVWWLRSGAYVVPSSSGATWQIPCLYLVFAHSRNRRTSTGGINYSIHLYDRSDPTVGVGLGYGIGVDRQVVRHLSFFGRNSIWSYHEGRVDGRAMGAEESAKAAASRGRPKEAGGRDAGWGAGGRAAPRIGDQVAITAGEHQRYVGMAWVVGEKYQVTGGVISDCSFGVMAL